MAAARPATTSAARGSIDAERQNSRVVTGSEPGSRFREESGSRYTDLVAFICYIRNGLSRSASLPARDGSTYETFYGLGQAPFTLSPDPNFLYLSESHDAAIRRILQSLRRNESFIVLSGDIGT